MLHKAMILGWLSAVAVFGASVKPVPSAIQAGVLGYAPARCHALVIGINQYKYWEDLQSAAYDAHAVSHVLRRYYGYGHVNLLVDEEATRQNILRALDRYTDLRSGDCLLIYYAGHGWMDSNRNGFWVPSDARRNEKFDYISNSQIVGDYLKKYKVKHLLVIADSCFSGAILRGNADNRGSTWRLSNCFKKPSRWILTSGGLAPVADDDGTGHSPFAQRILQYLKFSDSPAFGVQDLHRYIVSNRASDAICKPLDTTNHMAGGEYVFCRYDKPLPAKTQTVRLNCYVGGKLYLDGKFLGVVMKGYQYPMHNVAAGNHKVRIVGKHGTWVESFMVTDTEAPTLDTVQPEPPPKPPEPKVVVTKPEPKPEPKPQPKPELKPKTMGPPLVIARLGLTMVPIDSGSFKMGSPAPSAAVIEKPYHTVHITRKFWMSRTEITQNQYRTIMGKLPKGRTTFGGDSKPVHNVRWLDAVNFCIVLTSKEKPMGKIPAGYQYRLPTEAEWEYCCRAGTDTEYFWGKTSDNYKLYAVCGVKEPANVGSRKPNLWGLHDLVGNVYEWCLDACEARGRTRPLSYVDGIKDPLVSDGAARIMRGASYYNRGAYMRSAARYPRGPERPTQQIGFRIVLAPMKAPPMKGVRGRLMRR